MQTYPLFTEETQDERLPPIGREVFLSLPDEEKYHHFLYLFQRSQDLDYEVHDAREGLHQLQVELSKYRDILEEKKKQAELIAELNEKISFLQLEKEAWNAREQEENSALKSQLLDLQQSILIQQQEKQQLILEKELYENELKEREEQKDHFVLLERAQEENRLLKLELQKIKDIVLQALKEAKELKVKATAALQEKADLEKQASRFRSEAETLKRERSHFDELLRKLKAESQHLVPKLKDELDITRKELEQAKITLANRVKEATYLQDKQEEDRVNYLERIKKLEDRLQTERTQRDAEIARLAGGEELLLRLSPHIAALHKMVVDKDKQEVFEYDASTPSLFDSISKGNQERLF